MSLKEIQNLDATQLKERDAELRKQLFDLRSRDATEKVKDNSQFQKIRKDIARVQTMLRKQELAKQ